MSDKLYDVTIIGAGPVGLFAAFYAGMRDLDTLVLEALPRPGGQLTALYPEKYIYDVGGYVAVLARDLVQELWKQGSQFGAEFRFNEPVVRFEVLEPGRLRLITASGVYHSKTAIIATGLGAFSPNKIFVEGADVFENSGIHYVVHKKEDFLGKRLLIVGGGDTAVDWALELQQWAREITLIHRFDHFEAHERSVQALHRSKVHVLPCHELRLVAGDERLQEATVFNNITEGEHTLRIDDVLVCIGFKADPGPIMEWGLALEKRSILVNGKMETNLPGVYAAGDITQPADSVKMNLIANGFGQATLAVNLANQFIYPKSRIFPGHSSQKKGMRYAPVPVGHGSNSDGKSEEELAATAA
ncbi:MAG: NAD(P)/FAD-dependent oxidoreductase [Anaerolineales bacterium]|nr:NAD(P)/FAD-dependent oxidoreductase [Anaerolineales bacterium]